jgi:selenocysteine lyase/cysteine desulfurase
MHRITNVNKIVATEAAATVVERAKVLLQLEGTNFDTMLQNIARNAIEYVEQYTKRAVNALNVLATVRVYDRDAFRLPYAPFTITSVKERDVTGALTEINSGWTVEDDGFIWFAEEGEYRVAYTTELTEDERLLQACAQAAAFMYESASETGEPYDAKLHPILDSLSIMTP